MSKLYTAYAKRLDKHFIFLLYVYKNNFQPCVLCTYYTILLELKFHFSVCISKKNLLKIFSRSYMRISERIPDTHNACIAVRHC